MHQNNVFTLIEKNCVALCFEAQRRRTNGGHGRTARIEEGSWPGWTSSFKMIDSDGCHSGSSFLDQYGVARLGLFGFKSMALSNCTPAPDVGAGAFTAQRLANVSQLTDMGPLMIDTPSSSLVRGQTTSDEESINPCSM